MLDCGKGKDFSPVKYVLENQLADTVNYQGHIMTQLIVTHPHDDHIEDIDNLKEKLEPAVLSRQGYDWEDVKQPDSEEEYENLDTYAEWQKKYVYPASPIDWGFEIREFRLSLSEAKELDEAKYVNNSSIVVVVTYKGIKYQEKFLFGGDIETIGWEKLLENDEFQKAIKDVNFFVTSHHGHSSGFCSSLFDMMGKPFLNIVSANRRDKSVDSRYSFEEYARGIEFDGETRRMLSTRNDGTIIFDVDPEGRFSVSTRKLESNMMS